jgi:hypothetical protein
MSGPSGQDRVTPAQILATAARGLEVQFFFSRICPFGHMLFEQIDLFINLRPMGLNFVNENFLLQFFFRAEPWALICIEVNEWSQNFLFQNSNSDASQRPEHLAVVDPCQALRARIGVTPAQISAAAARGPESFKDTSIHSST